MTYLIDKSALLAEIKNLIERAEAERVLHPKTILAAKNYILIEDYKKLLSFIDSLEVREMGVWETVDTINPPQADRNKIYCVLSKNKYLLARVINHPQDEDLLQWRCTEFPFHRYDMCEGDKYMQIV